jgi:hypothetical protein
MKIAKMSGALSPTQDNEGWIPISLKTIEQELPEPISSIYKAQMAVIQAVEKPHMIEGLIDLVLARLDHAVPLDPMTSGDQIVKLGALSISHLLFLSNAWVVYYETGNQKLLEDACVEFAGRLANDICVSALQAGKTFQPKLIAIAILDTVAKNFKCNGKKFFEQIVRSLFGRSKAKTARREYLSLVVRVLGKAARRKYFFGKGQHLVDFLKRHESDILTQDLKEKVLSSREQLRVWATLILLPVIVALGLIIITGFGGTVWGHIWRIGLWGGTFIIAFALALGPLRSWLLKSRFENIIKKIYSQLEGQKVSLGPT